MTLSVGDPVVLATPTNPRLDGQGGTIAEVTGYGFLVRTKAAATGEFRALPDEVVAVAGNGQARVQGYTGNPCPKCLSMRTIWAGKCTQCLDCFESSGCS